MQMAVKMAILDVIENGLTDTENVIAYMDTDAFKKTVSHYVLLINKNF